MKSSTLGWVRLALAIPAALLVTLLVQMAATRVFGAMLIHPGERLANGLVLVAGVNTTKIVSSPFMAAALFWTLYLVAPKHRRSSVAVAALVVIGLWGGLMIFRAVMPWPRVHSWLFGIGLALWLGGIVPYWLSHRYGKTVQPASCR